MTREEFILFVRKADLMLRPKVVLMHPDTAEAVRAEWPGIDCKYVVHTSPYVDKSQCYLIDRADIEM
ncbi:MAG: hypothetical protein K6A05_04915 [Lachnospiraceae bacterium]|nr:hypothetical protein [Lachnospiraceae bacterium]